MPRHATCRHRRAERHLPTWLRTRHQARRLPRSARPQQDLGFGVYGFRLRVSGHVRALQGVARGSPPARATAAVTVVYDAHVSSLPDPDLLDSRTCRTCTTSTYKKRHVYGMYDMRVLAVDRSSRRVYGRFDQCFHWFACGAQSCASRRLVILRVWCSSRPLKVREGVCYGRFLPATARLGFLVRV